MVLRMTRRIGDIWPEVTLWVIVLVAPVPLASAEATAPDRLGESCAGNLWHRQEDACLSRLDAEYLDQSVTESRWFYPGGYPAGPRTRFVPMPKTDVVRWRDLFGSPKQMRTRAGAALAKPECVRGKGDVDHGLRNACAADDILRLGLLHEACVPFVARDGYADWEADWNGEFEQAAELAQFDVSYSGMHHVVARARVHFAWRLQRCRSVPGEALEPLAQLPQRPRHCTSPDWHQGHDLINIASRLGSPWAMTRSIGSNEDVNALAETALAFAYVQRAGKAFVNGDGLADQLGYLLAAMRHDAGVHIDWRGFEGAFTSTETEAGRKMAQELGSQGWIPLPESQRVMERSERSEGVESSKGTVRRWVTEDGGHRAMTADGTVVVVAIDC